MTDTPGNLSRQDQATKASWVVVSCILCILWIHSYLSQHAGYSRLHSHQDAVNRSACMPCQFQYMPFRCYCKTHVLLLQTDVVCRASAISQCHSRASKQRTASKKQRAALRHLR